LQVLREHLFNDRLWPDFTRLPSRDRPVLELQPIEVGQVLAVGRGDRRIEVLPAAHSVPACGFALAGPGGRDWVYTGDTGPNPALWQALAGRNIGQLVIEIAFPESERQVAAHSRHHCPSTLANELAGLPAGVQVLLTHIKPGELDSIRADLAARLPGVALQALEAGQRLHLD
jgi:ribonuclease BN (tRNA processing enzyme)